MEELLEAIRAATATDASDDAKAAGATACRAILVALEAKSGEPLAVTPAIATNIAAAVSVMQQLSPEQLMNLAIARLRAALPMGVEAPRVEPVKFNLVHLPRRA